MKAFHSSFAQPSYQPTLGYGQLQAHQSEHTQEAEAAHESSLFEEQESLEELPGMGLGQSYSDSDGNDPNRRSAGVHDVMAERHRRLLEDELSKKVRRERSPEPQPSMQARTRLDAYRERFQSKSAAVNSASSSRRSELEARLEARIDALMALQSIESAEPDRSVEMPPSPWDVSWQRAESAEAMGFTDYNYSTIRLPEDLPRVGF